MLLKEQCCWAIGNIISSDSEYDNNPNPNHNTPNTPNTPNISNTSNIPLRKVVIANGTLHIVVEYLYSNIQDYHLELARFYNSAPTTTTTTTTTSALELCVASGNRLQTALWVFCNLIRISDISDISDTLGGCNGNNTDMSGTGTGTGTITNTDMEMETATPNTPTIPTSTPNLIDTVIGGVSGELLKNTITNYIHCRNQESSHKFNTNTNTNGTNTNISPNTNFQLDTWGQYIDLVVSLVCMKLPQPIVQPIPISIGVTNTNSDTNSYTNTNTNTNTNMNQLPPQLITNFYNIQKEASWIIVYLTTKEDTFVTELLTFPDSYSNTGSNTGYMGIGMCVCVHVCVCVSVVLYTMGIFVCIFICVCILCVFILHINTI